MKCINCGNEEIYEAETHCYKCGMLLQPESISDKILELNRAALIHNNYPFSKENKIISPSMIKHKSYNKKRRRKKSILLSFILILILSIVYLSLTIINDNKKEVVVDSESYSINSLGYKFRVSNSINYENIFVDDIEYLTLYTNNYYAIIKEIDDTYSNIVLNKFEIKNNLIDQYLSISEFAEDYFYNTNILYSQIEIQAEKYAYLAYLKSDDKKVFTIMLINKTDSFNLSPFKSIVKVLDSKIVNKSIKSRVEDYALSFPKELY